VIEYIKQKEMNTTDWIGFIGVTILLLAFFLNLIGKIESESFVYLFMNFIGAGIACLASVLLKYVPFIILEASWTLVSAYGLYNYFSKKIT
jgi:hypothetical protein